jgi:hypothetical protein
VTGNGSGSGGVSYSSGTKITENHNTDRVTADRVTANSAINFGVKDMKVEGGWATRQTSESGNYSHENDKNDRIDKGVRKAGQGSDSNHKNDVGVRVGAGVGVRQVKSRQEPPAEAPSCSIN